MGKYDLDIEKYRKAVEKVIQRFADKGWEEIKLEEVWFETSIPMDIILEAFKAGVHIPPSVRIVTHRGNAVWRRQS